MSRILIVEDEPALLRALGDQPDSPELHAEIERLAGSILTKSAVAIRTGKGMFYKQLEMGLSDAYDYASEVMACNMMSDDAGEGIDAFMQKRKPLWTGS